MKKIGITVLVLVMIITCVGCQPTPSSSVVIQDKGNEYIEDAKTDNNEFIPLEVPEHVTESINQNDILTVNIDANVNLPDASAYATFEVEPKNFEESEIMDLVSFFSNGEPGDLYLEYYPSKDYWMQKIMEAKQQNITNQVYLEYIETQYENAQDETITAPLDFSEMTPKLLFDVYKERNGGYVSVFSFAKEYNDFSYKRNMDQEYMEESIATDDDWSAPGDPDISQEEAYEQALSYIDKFGQELSLYSAEPCSVFTGAGIDSTGWSFMFTRNNEGLQKAYRNNTFYVNPNAAPSYVAPWAQEVINVIIDKDGLAFIKCQGRSAEIENTKANVKLLDFESVKERVVNQLYYMYGTSENGEGDGLDIKVTDFSLGSEMLAVKDEAEKGTYIPVWRVDYIIKWKSQTEEYDETIYFNAINGAYIEPRVTTTDLMNIMS